MGLSVDVWNIDLPEIRVNPGQPREIANRHICRDVRMALGRITTIEDFERERTRVLSKPLPGVCRGTIDKGSNGMMDLNR